MLRHSDFIKEYSFMMGTDRDCEIPALMEFIKTKTLIDSLLDVGCRYTASKGYYAPMIRPFVKLYHGIDIIDDPDVKKIIDKLYVGNVVDFHPEKNYDGVVCLSTIEHAGISTYKISDYKSEQIRVFKRLLELANKWVWISFPIGTEYFCPNELAVIDEKMLNIFENLCSEMGWKYKERYFYSQGPQMRHPWYEHTKREVALKIPVVDFIGGQSICVMEIVR